MTQCHESILIRKSQPNCSVRRRTGDCRDRAPSLPTARSRMLPARRRRPEIRQRELHRLGSDYFVSGVGEFDPDLMRTRRQADHDHGSPLASTKCHGNSSTVTWMWPRRGDRPRAPLPNTGTTRRFSVRYWMKTMPRVSGSGSGGSTMSLGGGSFSMATSGDGPRISLALGASAALLRLSGVSMKEGPWLHRPFQGAN